jgi:hypothetical protein
VLPVIVLLRCSSNNLAGCSLVRIWEEELIAVGIIDHQEPVAPRTLLDRNALASSSARSGPKAAISASRVSGSTFTVMNISPLANLLWPLVGQDKRTTHSAALRPRDARSPVLLVAPGAHEAEPVNVRARPQCRTFERLSVSTDVPLCASDGICSAQRALHPTNPQFPSSPYESSPGTSVCRA